VFASLSAGEKRVLGALIVATALGAGVTAARRLRPEWFLGEPTFDAPAHSLPTKSSPASPAAVEATAPTTGPTSRVENPTGASAPAAAALASPSTTVALVDLNAADATALDALPGIGPVLAARIIAYRQENGGFRSVDELLEVRGIGPKTLDKLRSHVTVQADAPTQTR
jgi:competence protein ComEA